MYAGFKVGVMYSVLESITRGGVGYFVVRLKLHVK